MRGFPPITIPDPGRGARYGAPGYRDHAFNFPDKQGMYRVALSDSIVAFAVSTWLLRSSSIFTLVNFSSTSFAVLAESSSS